MEKDLDVIVIGAGAAGLSAAAELAREGLGVTILEARDRVGGRMFTLRDAKYDAPVELGAEFIHGRPPEIWNLLKRYRIRTKEVKGDGWCVRDGKITTCDFFSDVDKILKQMDARRRDQSFSEFLEHCCRDGKKDPHPEEAKEWATGYVTGFNAADPSLVGVHWLVREMRAEEKIDGDRAFRAEDGYAALTGILERIVNEAGATVHKNTAVESVHWRRGNVKVSARSANETFSAPRILVTVPLGVLQARDEENGAIRFIPALPMQKRKAIDGEVMGKVIRVTLRFRERFWESLPKDRKRHSKKMDNMSFLFSRDKWFPTWWTTASEKVPFLTGWAPFRCAEKLSGRDEEFVAEQSLRALHRLLGLSMQELENLFEHAYFHDWQNDPFSRGAYSYGKVGGDGVEEAIAKPIQNTLFFAGEATDTGGHNGTVHGAIASGKRAAAEIIKAAQARPSFRNVRKKIKVPK